MRFGEFQYQPDQRRLLKQGEPIDLSGRYLDALGLMLAEPGSLVTKDRFMDEVWRGVPVTDEALTQAIRALRKALGDDAASPRYIETVPKHGYRFIAPVDGGTAGAGQARPAILPVGIAGAGGGAIAGVVGGLFYAIMGGGAALLVLVALTAALGAVGGAGIGFGIGIGRALAGRSLASDALGGAAGGLVIGALARLLGIDAFTAFFGDAPMAMTGAFEGLFLGTATGLVVGLGSHRKRNALAKGGLAGAVAGLLIGLMGGRLMAGSLALLEATFPGAGQPLAMPFPGGFWFEVAITTLEAATFVAITCVALSSVEKRSAHA